MRRSLRGLIVLTLLLPACGSSGNVANSAPTSPPTGTVAPNFALIDQFGNPEKLSDFHGRLVMLTFIDSRCTTVCPLTAQLMSEAARDLGPNYAVQLVAINANPEFTSVSDVRRWSVRHRMLHRWLFLTGPVNKLKAVWERYGIQAKVVHGDVAHTAVIFLIDAVGQIEGAVPISKRNGIGSEAQSIARALRTVAESGT
jgi:cytochrome oxidase Cu insertion factor (SCO1/SenC/PrrC family)